MFYKIKKSSVSGFPTPKVNCHLLLFNTEAETVDENNAVHWYGFEVLLQDLIDQGTMTKEAIDERIRVEGEKNWNSDEVKAVCEQLELAKLIITPEIL